MQNLRRGLLILIHTLECAQLVRATDIGSLARLKDPRHAQYCIAVRGVSYPSLLLQGILLSLDLGARSIFHDQLLSASARPMRTISELDMGFPLSEIYVFKTLLQEQQELFVCPLSLPEGY